MSKGIAQSTANDESNLSHISERKCSDIAVVSQILDEARRRRVKVAPPKTVRATTTVLCEFCKFNVTHNILALEKVKKDVKNYCRQN